MKMVPVPGGPLQWPRPQEGWGRCWSMRRYSAGPSEGMAKEAHR